MTETRPEYIKCIQHTHADLPKLATVEIDFDWEDEE
jgi:hypothetical protein